MREKLLVTFWIMEQCRWKSTAGVLRSRVSKERGIHCGSHCRQPKRKGAKGTKMSNHIYRREAVGALPKGSLAATLVTFTKGETALAEEGQPSAPGASSPLAPAYRGANQIKPLPFDASKLKGLSPKLMTPTTKTTTVGLSNDSTRSSNRSAVCQKTRHRIKWVRSNGKSSSRPIR